MAIVFDKENKVFKLDTANTSYAFMLEKCGHLCHLYYGPQVATTDLNYIYRPRARGFSPYPYDFDFYSSRDIFPQEYATHGVGDFRVSGFIVRNQAGHTATDPVYVSHRIFAGKPKLKDLPATFGSDAEVETLEITLRDDATGMEFVLLYSVFAGQDVIARSARAVNRGAEKLYLEKMSSCTFDFWEGDLDLIHLWGSHCRERHVERKRLTRGITTISSTRGLSSHMHNPFFALAEPDATEEQGRVYGAALVYSGSFAAEIERDQFDLVRTQFGIHEQDFEWPLAPGEEFQAPEVLLMMSEKGLGGMSRGFHNAINKHLIRSVWRDQKRPILVNNWEGTYFKFTTEKLLNIAKDAAALGIEMLVLDDGWFGERDNDDRSLGDWVVYASKLPGGLEYLVGEVNKLGLKFGLWFEPEMISENSDLHRAHPDWVLSIPGRKRSLARNQMVLDMSRPEVVDYLFTAISKVLDSANIEYIKWDANRNLTEVASAAASADGQKQIFHKYVLGMYRLHELLLERYPKLLIEGCSGGGGRFDAGMLYYCPQIWTSDCSDAIERLKIQYGTSLVYPSAAMGAHVSDVPNHQTGRVSPFDTRGVVALAGTFGYELDLNKMSEEERAAIRSQVEMYHKYNHIVAGGDLYRLTDPFAKLYYCAWMQVTKDKSEFIVSYVQVRQIPHDPQFSVRLRGLDPKKSYRRSDTDEVYSGEVLMKVGFMLPLLIGDGTSALCYFSEV